MPDLTEQLAAYAARASEEVTPVRAADVTVEEPVTAGDAPVVELEPARKRRPRSVVWLAAAACVAAAALVAGMLVIRDDESADVVTEPPSGETFGYSPGWHELDPGPLSPRLGASVTWTNEELIVLGGSDHHDGAAYNPTTRTWRTIADPPWTGDGGVEAVWTGDELFVLGHPADPSATAQPVAAYDPASDTWRELASLPSKMHTDVRGELIWTGTEVLRVIWYPPYPDMVEITAYSEETGGWTELPAPPTSLFLPDDGAGNRYGLGWTGDDLVFAAFGRPTYLFDPNSRVWSSAAPAPAGRGAEASATWDGSALWLVNYQGNAASFDPASGTWTEQESPGESNHMCGLYGAPVVVAGGGSVVVDLCGSLAASTPDGEWETIDNIDYYENQLTLEPAGDTILAWASTNEPLTWPAEDPNRPPSDQWFRIWVPESPASSPPPTTPPSTPDASATFGYNPGWHELDAGPLSPRSGAALTWTGTEMIVLGGERHHDGAAYDPATKEWRTIADPPWADGQLGDDDGIMATLWTDDEMVAIGPDCPDCQRLGWPLAAYDPATDTWRELGAAPVSPYDARRHGFLWTGTELVLPSVLKAFDPDDGPGPWRDLPAWPEQAVGSPYEAVWTGEQLVFVSFEGPALLLDPAGGDWLLADTPEARDILGVDTTAAWDGTQVVLADGQGEVRSFDPSEGTWNALPQPTIELINCVPSSTVLRERAVIDFCSSVQILDSSDFGAEWIELPDSNTACCYAPLVSTGDVLLEWTSNDDTANDSTAPRVAFRLWVPDPALLDDEPGPSPPPTTPDTTPPTADTTAPTTEPSTETTAPGETTDTTQPEKPDLDLNVEAFGFEWFGVGREEAIPKAEDQGRAWRILRDDDQSFDIDDNLVDGRINFNFDQDVVTYASIESAEDGFGVIEGARDPADLTYVGLDEETMVASAEADGYEVRVVSRDGFPLGVRDDLRPERLNITVVTGIVVAIQRY